MRMGAQLPTQLGRFRLGEGGRDDDCVGRGAAHGRQRVWGRGHLQHDVPADFQLRGYPVEQLPMRAHD